MRAAAPAAQRVGRAKERRPTFQVSGAHVIFMAWIAAPLSMGAPTVTRRGVPAKRTSAASLACFGIGFRLLLPDVVCRCSAPLSCGAQLSSCRRQGPNWECGYCGPRTRKQSQWAVGLACAEQTRYYSTLVRYSTVLYVFKDLNPKILTNGREGEVCRMHWRWASWCSNDGGDS